MAPSARRWVPRGQVASAQVVSSSAVIADMRGMVASESGHGLIAARSTLTPNTWRVIVIGVVAAGVVLLFTRSARVRYVTIGVGIALVGTLVFLNVR